MNKKSEESVVGKTARVTMAIARGKTGEVIVEIRGGTERFIAMPDLDTGGPLTMSIGEKVIINEALGRIVLVSPYLK